MIDRNSMRIECEIFECGNPAVDFLERDGEDGERVRLYLHADHASWHATKIPARPRTNDSISGQMSAGYECSFSRACTLVHRLQKGSEVSTLHSGQVPAKMTFSPASSAAATTAS